MEDVGTIKKKRTPIWASGDILSGTWTDVLLYLRNDNLVAIAEFQNSIL